MGTRRFKITLCALVYALLLGATIAVAVGLATSSGENEASERSAASTSASLKNAKKEFDLLSIRE